jgi:hypothetical protein
MYRTTKLCERGQFMRSSSDHQSVVFSRPHKQHPTPHSTRFFRTVERWNCGGTSRPLILKDLQIAGPQFHQITGGAYSALLEMQPGRRVRFRTREARSNCITCFSYTSRRKRLGSSLAPGKTRSRRFAPMDFETTSPSTALKSVVTARSRPSLSSWSARPGQRP